MVRFRGQTYTDDDLERRTRLNDMLDRVDELEGIFDRLEILLFGRSQAYLYPDVYKSVYESLKNPVGNYRNIEGQLRDLTPKMKRFVEEYPKDLNATAAAVRAGYSKRTATQRAAFLLTYPKVVRALRRKLDQIARRNKVTQDRVIREIARIAFANIRDYLKWSDSSVSLIPSESLTRGDTAAIKEISETSTSRSTTIKVKLYDKPQALHTLCKYLGLLDNNADREKDHLQQAKEKLKPYIGRLVNVFDTQDTKEVKVDKSGQHREERVEIDSEPISTSPPKEITLSDDLPDNVVSLEKKLRRYERRLGLRN